MVTLFLSESQLSTSVERWVVEDHFPVDGYFFKLQTELFTDSTENNCCHLFFSAEYDPLKPFSVVLSGKMIHFKGNH